MPDGFDEVYVDTRRQLRGVAESLIAGPQYAGDDYHRTPDANVSPWTARTGQFWNTPFGAVYPLDPVRDVDALTSHIADFFNRGRRES